MFAKFKLDAINIRNEKYYDIGKSLYNENKASVHSILDKYITKDNALSAQKIEDDWFPNVNADIFLSHAHSDERSVIELAGCLKDTFNVRTFIDSCVWGYCDDLINAMENRYNLTRDKNTTRQICSHVNMILNTALHKMIDKTECLIFYNTPQSVKYIDYFGKMALRISACHCE